MENQDYYENLLSKSISLYTHGTLMQYGLREEQALEIVSNLTRLSPEKLQELKNNRVASLTESMSNSNEVISSMLSR